MTKGISTMERRAVRFVERRTSISLEPQEWELLEDIAAREAVPLKYILMQIDKRRGMASTPSATRLFLLAYWRAIAEGRQTGFVHPTSRAA